MNLLQSLGLVAAIIMPLWNIPLILRIRRRKSSRDLSLPWAFGVFGCILLMLPAALFSSDPIFKTFSIMNTGLFSLVVLQILRYR